MTNSFTEKRKSDRHIAICKVIVDKAHAGYLIDISKTGVRLWINKSNDIAKSFSIEVLLPSDLQQKSRNFYLNPVWTDEKKSIRFNEVGCQFQKLNPIIEEELDNIIDLFQKIK